MSVVVAMGKFTPVQTEYAIKDHLPKTTTRVTAHVVVGTPGTMTDLIRRRVIDMSAVKVFVLDEADDMLNQDGLGDQTLRVKKCVYTLLDLYGPVLTMQPSTRQSACFLVATQYKYCFSPPPSRIMCAILRASSRLTPTKLSSSATNCLWTTFVSSTWTARTKSTNTTYSSHCTTC